MSKNNSIQTKSNFQDLPEIPIENKLTAAEVNQITGFQKSPVQKLTAFVDTDIIIDGTKEYSTTKAVAGATHTITASDDDAIANTLSSEHVQGNELRVRYQFDVDCTLTLVNFDTSGNNTGTITPIPAGTYDFKFKANARGVNLDIPQNVSSEQTQDIKPFNNIYYVKTTGNDGTAVKNDPNTSWLTIKAAALAAYTDSVTDATNNWNQVYVHEGVYNENSIAYPEIEMFFEDWAIVYCSSGSVINDFNAQGQFKITGLGRFYSDVINPAADRDAINFKYATSGNNLDISAYEIGNGQFWSSTGSQQRNLIIRNAIIKYDFHNARYTSFNINNCTYRTGFWKGGWNTGFLTKSQYNNCRFELPSTSEIAAGFHDVLDKDGSVIFTATYLTTFNKILTVDPVSIQAAVDDSDYKNLTGAIQHTLNDDTSNSDLESFIFNGCTAVSRRENTIGVRWYEIREDSGNSSLNINSLVIESDVTLMAGYSFDNIDTLTSVRPINVGSINVDDCSQKSASKTGSIQINPNELQNKLDKLTTADQTVASNLLHKKQVTVEGLEKTFSATLSVNFSTGTNGQEMPVEGNITSFTTSEEKSPGNYDVWLVNDATPGRTVAAPTGWILITGGDTHDDAANAVNLYQFKVSPSGLKRYIIKNM